MSSVFGSVPVPKKGRSLFNESHSVSGTFPLAKCVPVFMTETIPGDSWNINVFNLSKLETLLAPAMQRVDASLLWFKLPKRLVFRHFKKWYSGGEDGQDSHQKPHIYFWEFVKSLEAFLQTLSLTPGQKDKFVEALFGPGSLWSYIGLFTPIQYNSTTGVWEFLPFSLWQIPENYVKSDVDYIDIMPFLAYHMIYDQYFRDQTLSSAAFEDADEGVLKVNPGYNPNYRFGSYVFNFPSVTGNDLAEGGEVAFADMLRLLFMFNRAWKKEYFTSALPTPQRGPEVTIGITEDAAPVSVTGSGSIDFRAANLDPDDRVVDDPIQPSRQDQDGSFTLQVETSNGYKADVAFKNIEGLSADLSGLSPITITAFRNLFKLQSFLEKNNVAGGRYIEAILAHWAERVPDFTVQRAQHVRSTSIPVQISEVTATANSSGLNSQVGDQGGRGRAQGNLGNVHIYTQEPSFIFALYCVGIPPAYGNQGIHRMWQRITRFDEPWRDFQHIGEQAIKERELYYSLTDLSRNDLDFGYQQRYSEFKYMPDRVVGDFLTTHSYWHMARLFNSSPALNGDFVKMTPDERIFAVQNVRPVTSDFYFDAVAKRKLSKFSTPKLT